MSIVNISSENRVSGNDAEFEVNLKRSLQNIIGVQVLNVTVPLTYSVFNPSADRDGKYNNEFYWYEEDTADSGNLQIRGASIEYGTFTADDTAKKIEEAMNRVVAPDFPHYRNAEQRQIHIDNRRDSLTIGEFDQCNYYNGEQRTQIKFADVKPGFILTNSSGSYFYIVRSFKQDGTGILELLSSNYGDPTHAPAIHTIANYSTDGYSPFSIVWPGYLVFYDNEIERITFSNGGSGGTVPSAGATQFEIAGTLLNSRRLLKTIGLVSVGDGSIVNQGSTKHAPLGSQAAAQNRNGNLGRYITCPNVPEVSGPSLLFLRLSGDVLLDQQNSEDSMNDRIPIPIDVPHGGVVHYENDSEADVIPFSVPCEVRRLKFRLEYGDDNGVVGGAAENLRGHELYVRLKFFKMHQQGGKKM